MAFHSYGRNPYRKRYVGDPNRYRPPASRTIHTPFNFEQLAFRRGKIRSLRLRPNDRIHYVCDNQDVTYVVENVTPERIFVLREGGPDDLAGPYIFGGVDSLVPGAPYNGPFDPDLIISKEPFSKTGA